MTFDGLYEWDMERMYDTQNSAYEDIDRYQDELEKIEEYKTRAVEYLKKQDAKKVAPAGVDDGNGKHDKPDKHDIKQESEETKRSIIELHGTIRARSIWAPDTDSGERLKPTLAWIHASRVEVKHVIESDDVWSPEDCYILTVLEARYNETKWQNIQANFANLTGRNIDAEVLKAKFSEAIYVSDAEVSVDDDDDDEMDMDDDMDDGKNILDSGDEVKKEEEQEVDTHNP
ncbi:hypothetical protein F4677DRAFT_444467 [Hypoxylon crocopeplum]|nr:hypothetical protein F4677DRAFT_444467 [Hypoxylon crocopeplum]